MRRMGIVIAAMALAACASDPGAHQSAATSNDCFRTGDVSGYSVIDDTHVGFSVGASRRYVLTTMWNANSLDWTSAIAIRTATGRVCTGNGLGVELIGGEPRRTYPIVSVERAPDDAPAVQGS
ncbi:MAG: DUF6491 family protein [Vitreimonas sp.]